MAYYRNVTKVDQILYGALGQRVSVKPGESVDSEVLGYEPGEDCGFKKLNFLQSVLTEVSPDSKKIIPASNVSAESNVRQEHLTVDPSTLSLEEKLKRDEVNPEDVSPTARAMMEAMLQEKQIPGVTSEGVLQLPGDNLAPKDVLNRPQPSSATLRRLDYEGRDEIDIHEVLGMTDPMKEAYFVGIAGTGPAPQNRPSVVNPQEESEEETIKITRYPRTL